MPKKKKTRDVEEILDGNIDQFEKGFTGRDADDLDETIRKLGRYEDEEVTPRPVAETDRETPPAEEDLRPGTSCVWRFEGMTARSYAGRSGRRRETASRSTAASAV
jgi:hypothetical protein